MSPAAPPPPLDPPVASEPPRRPSFLRTAEELPNDHPRRRTPARDASSLDEGSQARGAAPDGSALEASPWVDLTFTSFWMSQRVGNFLNLGAQFGGYFFERLRLSARLVVPLGEVDDGYSSYDTYAIFPGGNGDFVDVDSPNMSVLYSGSVGVILASTKSFVFAPGFVVERTDVNDYGTTVALALPFEWTSKRNLRTGFELAIGHAFGGTVQRACITGATPCAPSDKARPGGTAFTLQFNMGWELGHL